MTIVSLMKIKGRRNLISDSEDQGSDAEAPSCRICFQETLPLIKLPCLCKGSLSFVHEKCLNDFINSKEDHGNDEREEKNRVVCEICTFPMDVETSYQLNWGKIYNIKVQIYFILFGITCISIFGLHIAGLLFNMAMHQENGFIEKFQYFIAYIWIIGVILYVLFEPIFSELKENRIKVKQSKVISRMRKPHAKKKHHHD